MQVVPRVGFLRFVGEGVQLHAVGSWHTWLRQDGSLFCSDRGPAYET